MDPSWLTSQPKSAENQGVQVPGKLAAKGTSDIPDPDNRPQILGIAAPNLGQQSLTYITAPGSSSSQITQAGSFAGYSRPMLNAMLQDDIPFVVPSALVNHTAGQHAGPSIGTFSDLPAGWSQVPISILRLAKKRAEESDTMPQLPLSEGATLPPDLPSGSQYGTSVQLTQNHFLPLGVGGASNMVTSNMALPPSTSVTPDKYGSVTAPFQPNGPGAEASKAGSVTEACIQRQSATVVVKNSCTKEASITPRKANGVRGQHPQELNCLAGEGSAEDNTQKYPGMQTQAKTRTNQSDDPALLTPTVSNKCTFTQIEMQISEVEQLETIINENETQVQRSKPRRKRHRPKVIREGKPSKTQETAVSTPKVPPKSTVKRTNIRKKRSISSLGNSPGPSGDKSISSAEALTFKGQATSVRRRLQFEHEGHAVSGEQRTMTNSQHHSQVKLHHPQALKCSVTQSEVGQGLQLEIENEPGGIVSGPSHKLNENSPGYPQPQAPSAASGYFGRAVQLDNSRDMALKQDNVSSAHNLDTTRQFVSQIDERLGTNSLNVDGLQIYCSARLLSETGSAESQMSKVQQVENQKHEQHSNWKSISIGTRNSILRTTAKIVASCQAGGIKKKRSICSSKIPSDLIKDLEKNTSQACQTSSQSCMDALPETTHLKFTTKKRPQRARLHSSSCVEPNMENKNRASTGNIFSSRSNGSSSSKPLQGSLPWTLIGYTPHNTSTNVDICNKLPKGCMVSTSAMPYMDSSRSVQNNLDLSSEQVYRNETHLSVAASPNIVPLRTTSDLQNALVPYVGSTDPYGRAWNLVKKQRAKVDLDFESTRAWNLLMGKTVKPVDGADVEKEKWWQQERNVFQGRANSFIARMRLVQGDRHFSPWKGSVVDSVVGVFLTQNVTDHLSSSAFMALAASFPPRSTDNNSKDDKGSKDNEEITRLAVQDENRLHFCGNGVRLDLNVHCENLSQIHDRIRTDPKNNTCDSELIKDDNYYLCDEASNESLYNHQGTKGPKAQPFAENSSIELAQSTEDAQEIQFHQEIDSSQSIPTSETFLQSGLSMCSGEDHKPQNFVDNLGIAAFQVLEGNSYDENISAGNNAVVDEVGYQITGMVTVTDDLCQPGISRSMLYPIISDVNHPQYDAQNKSFGSPTSAYVSSGSSSLNKTNSTMEKCSSLFMPHDAYTTQNNGNSVVDATLEFPVKLHHNKHTIFEASDLKDSIAFSTTDLKSGSSSYNEAPDAATHTSKPQKTIVAGKTRESFDWDSLRRQASANGYMKERNSERRDSVDWEAVRSVHVQRISHVIRDRGMNNILAERIQEFLNRLVRDHGSIDLEWLRDIPPDSAKDYLLSIRGLGLKSVECVRLLTLHHLAFPVDTNVGRICVRLGWVPLQPLPESLQLHLLELYPVQATIQKYLWPRLCKLDLQTLYELHYQMITFGKVFCTKNNPNCNACPMRSECKHFASAFASARLALPAPQEKSLVDPINLFTFQSAWIPTSTSIHQPQLKGRIHEIDLLTHNSEPVIEEPESPREEENIGKLENDIEDFYEDPDQIPTIKLNMEAFTQNLEGCLKESNKDLQTNDIAKALVSTDPGVASIPVPKLKNVNRLRTEHYVYELPDSHPLTQQLELDQREPDDPSPYLLIIRMLDETKETSKAPMSCCSFQVKGGLCNNDMCHTCASERENQSRYVKGTILVPCRTAMRGNFPLNGTYFQVNEVFADHSSSHNPVLVPREQLWNLRGRIVYFGTSVPTIFKGLTTEEIQQCFWKGMSGACYLLCQMTTVMWGGFRIVDVASTVRMVGTKTGFGRRMEIPIKGSYLKLECYL